MKSTRILSLIMITLIVFIIAIPVSIGVRFVIWTKWGLKNDIQSKQQILKTMKNGSEVLAGCREILSKSTTYRADPKWNGSVSGAVYPDPTDPAIPPAIRALAPSNITIDAGKKVTLEFGGGFSHFGLRGYAVGILGEGNKDIVPGLWFYAEDDMP